MLEFTSSYPLTCGDITYSLERSDGGDIPQYMDFDPTTRVITIDDTTNADHTTAPVEYSMVG